MTNPDVSDERLAMSTRDLPPWPEGQPQWDKNPSTWHWERAEAALARLRIAVDALDEAVPALVDGGHYEVARQAREALSLIDDIPAPPSQERT